MRIETQDIVLRDFVRDDAKFIADVAGQPEFNFYNLTGDFNTSVKFVERAMSLAAKTPRTCFKLAVTLKESGLPIGYVAFDDVDGTASQTPDVGYFVDPRHQGTQFATKAMSALMHSVIEMHPSIDDINATAHPDNIGSQKVLQKLSFMQTGDTLKYVDTLHGREPRLSFITSATRFLQQGVISDLIIEA